VNRSRQRASGWTAEALQQLHESLLAERDALVREDLDALAHAVQSKEQTLRHLAAGLTAADSTALREALRPLRDLNDRNARLLAPRIQLNRARVATLLGTTHSDALYSANGRAGGAQNRPQRGVRA